MPAAPGFYAWWSRRGALPAVPRVSHPADDEVSLLHVGVSPVRESSRQTLRTRALGNHLNGNVGSSTFRFVLAALLIDALQLEPFVRGSKIVLDASDNAWLSAWQRDALPLTWSARERRWEIEGDVIRQLAPPLNSAGKAAHSFYACVRRVLSSGAARSCEPDGWGPHCSGNAFSPTDLLPLRG